MIRTASHTPAAAFLLALGLTLGCSANADRTAVLSRPVTDTLPGGVVRVTNTGPTLWAGDSGWRFTEGITIAPPEGSPGELSEVRAIVSDAQGNVYVLQNRPTVIKAFGPDGAWIRDIGREGDGPGEFRDGMLALVGDTLVIQDPNNTRMTTFLTDGTFLTTHQSQCCWSTSTFPSFADGTVAILGPPPPETVQSGAYYFTHMDGRVSDTVLMLPRQDDPEGNWTIRRTSGQNRSIMMTDIPNHPQPVAVWRSDRLLVRGTTDDYTLTIGRTFRDTLRIFTSTAPSLTLTDAQRDSLYETTIANTSEQWRESLREVAKLGDIPNERPRWHDLAVDDANRIWVGLPGPTSDVETLEVFSPDGVLLGRLPAPDPNILRGIFVGDRVVLQDETELGLPRIRLFRISRAAAD